ncbi:hypothetical protein CYMTET_31567 [Cymbomonas tetramitiformis]|uniref:Uncharacterized protein n=1 Tax=Cymbomonas tetramitiformis TaxID=36881 RepID=A0AAE0FGY4_9CHLO|nr:hypothetical protein CYMTET_31567 [Cymbomonas tetramitiformis]
MRHSRARLKEQAGLDPVRDTGSPFGGRGHGGHVAVGGPPAHQAAGGTLQESWAAELGDRAGRQLLRKCTGWKMSQLAGGWPLAKAASQ